MDFQKLCTLETFQRVWSHYGYGGHFEEAIGREFTRIKGNDRVRPRVEVTGRWSQADRLWLLLPCKQV